MVTPARRAVAAEGLTGRRGRHLAGIGYALSQILTLASYLVLARLATPTEFGQFTAVSPLVGLARLYTESGMLGRLVYRRDRLEEPPLPVVATFLGGLIFALVMLALAPVIGSFFDSETITGVAAAASDLPSCERFP